MCPSSSDDDVVPGRRRASAPRRSIPTAAWSTTSGSASATASSCFATPRPRRRRRRSPSPNTSSRPSKMEGSSVTQPLSQGLWGVLATPFDDDLDVDLASLRNEVASFAADGATAWSRSESSVRRRRCAPTRRTPWRTPSPRRPTCRYVLGLVRTRARRGRRAGAAAARRGAAPAGRADGTDQRRRSRGGRRLAAPPARRDRVGILIQDYPVVSGVSVTDEQVVAIVSGLPVRGRREIGDATDVRRVAHLAPRVDVPVFGGLGGVGLLDELAAGSAGAMTGFSHPAALAAVLRAAPGRWLRRGPRRVGAVAAARQLRGTAAGRPGDPQRAAAATRRDRPGPGASACAAAARHAGPAAWTSTSRPCPPPLRTR